MPDRQQYGELGPLPRLAGNPDVAAMILDDAVGYGQPQAGPAGLGGEERGEQFFHLLRRECRSRCPQS